MESRVDSLENSSATRKESDLLPNNATRSPNASAKMTNDERPKTNARDAQTEKRGPANPSRRTSTPPSPCHSNHGHSNP
jgi:hypothetical protein